MNQRLRLGLILTALTLAGCAADDDPPAESLRRDRVAPRAERPEAAELDTRRGTRSTPPVPANAVENDGAESLADEAYPAGPASGGVD